MNVLKTREATLDVKDFSKYLKHNKSFDELLHHIRRISVERTTDNDLPDTDLGLTRDEIVSYVREARERSG